MIECFSRLQQVHLASLQLLSFPQTFSQHLEQKVNGPVCSPFSNRAKQLTLVHLDLSEITVTFFLLLWFPPIIQAIGLFWHHWRLCKWFTCTSFVSKSAVGSFGQYIYFIELCIWLLHVFFVGIHPSNRLVTTEFFFIKWTYFFYIHIKFTGFWEFLTIQKLNFQNWVKVEQNLGIYFSKFGNL